MKDKLIDFWEKVFCNSIGCCGPLANWWMWPHKLCDKNLIFLEKLSGE